MGMILPWRFVRHGPVPEVSDFHMVAEEILGIAGQDRSIKAAAFLGSLSRGDLYSRSDLDLIVVGHDSRFSQSRVIVSGFRAIARERGVPLDCTLHRSSMALGGRHAYGPSFLETFPRVSGDYTVGASLQACFRIPNGSVQAEMLERLEHKLRSTRMRAWNFRERRSCPDDVERWLETSWNGVVRPMRVYITLGRRLLWWLHGVLPLDGKTDVIEQFLAERAFAAFHEDYRLLIALDERYNDVLDRARHNETERRGTYLKKVGALLTENFRVSLRLLSGVLAHVRGRAVRAA